MLNPTPRMVSKISTHLCVSWPKVISFDQIRKTQLLASTVEAQIVIFFKILKISSGYDGTHLLNSLHGASSLIFCLGDFYVRWWLSNPFRVGVRVLTWLWNLNEDSPSISKPYQTK